MHAGIPVAQSRPLPRSTFINPFGKQCAGKVRPRQLSASTRPIAARRQCPQDKPFRAAGWARPSGRSAHMNERQVSSSGSGRVNGRDWVTAAAKLAASLDPKMRLVPIGLWTIAFARNGHFVRREAIWHCATPKGARAQRALLQAVRSRQGALALQILISSERARDPNGRIKQRCSDAPPI
jgi:hypothetical protein